MNMTFNDSFLELIRNRLEITGDDMIDLSLGEIANVWGANATTEKEELPRPYFTSDESKFSRKYVSITPRFLEDIIAVIKKLEKENLVEFLSVIGGKQLSGDEKKKKSSVSDIAYLTDLEDKIFLEIKEKLKAELKGNLGQKNALKSIHLVSESIVAKNVIFLVLDEQWQIPVRFLVWNNGIETAIKKLHNIAYFADVQNKRVEYSKGVADNINNGLFKKPAIAKYMKTNKLDKPTLVQKSKDGILVLKNEIPITIISIEKVPSQYRSQYIDKTK